jgi:fructose-1,6-bisphosphatase/inositol monophosphatase family enzyme
MQSWDMAAGMLMVQEAGGVVLNDQVGSDATPCCYMVMGNPTTVAALHHVIQGL